MREAVKGAKNIALIVGPEGGFTALECQKALENGAQIVTLGRRILRTETAGLATLSMLVFCLDE